MAWYDDVGDFFEEAADTVVTVATQAAGDVIGAATGMAGEVLGPIAAAVDAIPVLGDAVEFVAPLAGPLGAMIGGPVGAMIGNTVGNAFGGDGPNFMDVLDGALDTVSGALPPPIDGVADDLLDGGTLINAGMAVLGGGLPDVGDIADKVGDAFGIDLGNVVGAAADIANGELPDLGDAMGAAQSVFDGFGLGNIGSTLTGAVIGSPAPEGADGDAGGSSWFDGFDLGGLASPGFEITNCWGGGNPINEAGGGWLEDIVDQANDLPGTAFDWALPEVSFPNGNTGVVPPTLGGDVGDTFETMQQDFLDNDLDDLVFNMPGVDRDGAARDALQQLAESGGLGAALASMAPDDVTALVSRLVNPIMPAAEAVQSDNDTIVDIDDGMTIPGGTTSGADDGFNDPLGIGIDDITGDPVGVGAATSGEAGVPDDALIEQSAAAAQVDDFSIDAGIDAGGGAAVSAPAEPEYSAPEPEPVQSDFSESMAQADAVETQLDDDVDGFFTGLG